MHYTGMIELSRDDMMFPSVARAKLELWHSYFVGKDLLDTPQAAFQQANPVTFSNNRKAFVTVMVLPIKFCETEHLYSTLLHIKTYSTQQ